MHPQKPQDLSKVKLLPKGFMCATPSKDRRDFPWGLWVDKGMELEGFCASGRVLRTCGLLLGSGL